MDFKNARRVVYDSILKAETMGLVRLSAGNFSLRLEGGLVAVTPTSIKYDVLQPEQIAIIDLDGNLVDGSFKPTSEVAMHTAIFRNLPQVGAICHTHSVYAITFAALGLEVPAVTIEMLVCGAPIPVVPWETPGTPALGDGVVRVMKPRPDLKVVLLQSHGLVAVGKDLDQALEMALDAEIGLQVYHQALQHGTPRQLSRDLIPALKGV